MLAQGQQLILNQLFNSCIFNHTFKHFSNGRGHTNWLVIDCMIYIATFVNRVKYTLFQPIGKHFRSREFWNSWVKERNNLVYTSLKSLGCIPSGTSNLFLVQVFRQASRSALLTVVGVISIKKSYLRDLGVEHFQ
jgi:hypothetical protein